MGQVECSGVECKVRRYNVQRIMYIYRNGIMMTTMIHTSQIDLDLKKDENPVLRFDQYSAFVRVQQGHSTPNEANGPRMSYFVNLI